IWTDINHHNHHHLNSRQNFYVEAIDYWRKLGPLSPNLKIGTKCHTSLECLLFVPHSHCDCNKRCSCQPYHIFYNETMCLPASLLGYACKIDEQCNQRVPNAQCLDGRCRCQANYLPLRRDKCLPQNKQQKNLFNSLNFSLSFVILFAFSLAAKSGDFCLNDQQCLLGNRYSKCKYIIPRIYGKCVCLEGYHRTNDDRCLPTLRSECDANKNECNEVIPNSHCSRLSNDSAVCECLPGFLESNHHHQSCEPIPTTTTTTTMTPKTIETQPMQTITGIYLSLLINFF
ncbi:hypothetical protein QR98_0050210, partial [Sarcoptes scabiei]